MKILNRSALAAAILILIVSFSFAQADSLKEITVVVPAQSIQRTVKPLLPYKVDFGEKFLGDLYVQSIENIEIKKDKILFSALINGNDIRYATKIGNQSLHFVVGDVNLPTNWELSFKFDKTGRRLLVLPSLHGLKAEKDFSQGDALLNALLAGLSGQEYPIELGNLRPIKSEFFNQLLSVNMQIVDIYAAEDKLFVELVPAVQIDR